MRKVTRLPWKIILIISLGVLFIYFPITQISGIPPIQAYQVAASSSSTSLSAYQGDYINSSLSITQIYFEEVYNVTIETEILDSLEFLYSTEATLDEEIEADNETESFSYNFGILDVDEKILFTATYNVTSPDPKEIELPSFNVSFILRNGEERYIETNTVQVFLRGEREVPETESLPTIPRIEIPAHPIFSLIGFSLPLITFSVSIIFMKKIR